jgi:iron complex outermembrane recepter protein
MKRTSLHTAIVAALAGSTAAVTQIAWAQNQSSEGLEEIVVTATRREQNLQDVPLAVIAFSGDMLERQGIENMEDLKAVVPNLVVAGNLAGTNTASFTMRGIPNVGTYIDGIWQVSNNGLLLREFVDVDRVEVLRGPQGTLYGRDSTGGAIRLYTKGPSDQYGVQLDMTVGNLDRRDIKGTLDLPFTDNFRSRFTLASYDRDGYITSLTTGQKTGAFQNDIVRADFIWEPSERVSLRFNAQQDTVVDTQARVNTFISNQIGFNSGYQMGLSLAYDLASGGRWNCHYTCSGEPGGLVDKWEGRQDTTVPSREWLEQQTVDLKVEVTDNIGFQYLLGHTYNDTRQYNDWDAGEFNFYIDYFNNELDLTSHEFQFTGGRDRFTWVGGAYLWDQTGRGRNPAYSMADWTEANPPGQPGSYPNSVAEFNYNAQVIGRTVDAAGNPTSAPTSAACQMTPAQRGITSWAPGVAAGYVPAMVGPPGAQVPTTSLDVNSVSGWPYPCGFIPGPPFGPPFPADWVTALAGGARPPAGDRLTGDEIDGYALFGEVTIGITEKFDLTVGYRYHDQSQDSYAFDIGAGVAAGITAPKPPGPNLEWASGGVYEGIRTSDPARHVAFDADTYRLSGSWHLTDDVMVYAGYTEGFNSGGLATYSDCLGPVESAYDPETIENTELGLRSDFVDGRVRLNATYFNTDWVDIQLLSTVKDRCTGAEITELVLQNSAAANAEGIELEMVFAATDNLTLNANLGWLDTAYTETNSPAVRLDTEFSAAPDNTYNFGVEHRANVGSGGSFTTRFDATYTGAYWRSPTPSLRQNAYGVARDYESGDYWRYNAQLAYQPSDGRYQVTLYGTNLTNEYQLNSGFLHNIWQFDFATVDRPREVGVGVRMNF